MNKDLKTSFTSKHHLDKMSCDSGTIIGSTSSPKQWGCSKTNYLKVTYDWTVTDFSLRPEEIKDKITSPVFYSNADKTDKWQLELYPRGDGEHHKDHLSLFLKLLASEKSEISLQCKFSVLKTTDNVKTNAKRFFRKYMPGTTLGYPCFMTRVHLTNPIHALLTNDNLTICCEIYIPTDTVQTSYEGDQPIIPLKTKKRLLTHDLQYLLESSKFTDVMIIAGDKKFPAHKLILSSRSSVLSAMIDYHSKDKTTDVIQVETSPEIMKGVLQFIYTDEVSELGERIEEYLTAAEKYELTGLKGKCEDLLAASVNEVNVVKYLIMAHRCRALQLKDRLIEFIMSHLPRVLASEGFKDLHNYPVLMELIIQAQAAQMEDKSMVTE